MILQRTATIPSTGVPGARVVDDVSMEYIEPNVETNETKQESEHESIVGYEKCSWKPKKGKKEDVSRWFNDHQNIKYHKCNVHSAHTWEDRPSIACSNRCTVRTRTHLINFYRIPCGASEQRAEQPSRAYIPLFGCVRIAIHFCWISHGLLWRICTTRTEIPNYFCRTNWNQSVASELNRDCLSCELAIQWHNRKTNSH